MTPWFLKDFDRVRLEREGVDRLQANVEWLVGHEWTLLNAEIGINAVIRARGHDYEVRISFPPLYPDVPSVVRPIGAERRLSQHQYGGADGPLCLEWGPDNWHRDITAVQMFESAHRLLDIEDPEGSDGGTLTIVAPSRHSLSVGQELRTKPVRWYYTTAEEAYFLKHAAGSVGNFRFSLRLRGQTWVALLHEASPLDGDTWRDASLPADLPGGGENELHTGVWFKTSVEGADFRKLDDLKAIRAVLGEDASAPYIPSDGPSLVEGWEKPLPGVMIIDASDRPHFFVVLSNDSILQCSVVRSADSSGYARAPDTAQIQSCSVGIVGLGSAGSKIAMTLARMGVQDLYLVDHDILLPENLQRHALDWDSVAQHKADALSLSIRRVSPRAKVDVSKTHLTGQESSAVLSGELQRLGGCDLIVDATADPAVFNLLSAVARAYSRPVVWLEVFGGGIGGLIGRSRPGMDPAPLDMRALYLQYCKDNPASGLSPLPQDYAAENSEGDVLIASDADVAIIAHHAARLAIDCLVSEGTSRFPYSLYLVGLTTGWVFEAPFATIPISAKAIQPAEGTGGPDTSMGPDVVEFVLGLCGKTDDESPSTP